MVFSQWVVHYISYRVDNITTYRIRAGFGVIYEIDSSRNRIFTPTIRIGSYQLDNTHNLPFGSPPTSLSIPGNEDLLRLDIWKATDMAYKNAAQTYEMILTNQKVRVAEEDKAADFSAADPLLHFDPPVD
ncbi:hypothetical protein GCM10027051_15570 [Niabella terrae]